LSGLVSRMTWLTARYRTAIFICGALLALAMLSSNVSAGRTVVHNGRPFFPIGIYHYPEGLPLEPRLEELAEAGFNTVLSGLTSSTDFMDSAHEHGIGVLPTLGWNMVLSAEGDEAKRQYLRENIERLKGHPALLGYEAPDEIAWVDYSQRSDPGGNLEGVLRGYRYIRSIDPDTPIWMNHAPRNTVEYLRSYSEAGDVLGTDIYPVPAGKGHSDLDQSLNCVGQYTEKLEEVGQGKPIYMVLQGFSWEDLHQGSMAPQPNWVETRFMAYDAICHGANGIIYWGMRFTRLEDDIWGHLKRIASEMRDLTPVLLNGSRRDTDLADPDLSFHLWEYEGYHYLFVLNTRSDGLPTRSVKLPDSWTGGGAEVLFEGRTLEVQDGAVMDSFPAYGVHIYSDDTRADLTIDATNPGLLVVDREAILRVRIANDGSTSTPHFDLALEHGAEVLISEEVRPIPPGTGRSLELNWTPSQTGEIVYRVVADIKCEVEERTRTNNAEALEVNVAEAGPDLRVGPLFMIGQDTLCAKVSNPGYGDSEPFNVSCTLGGTAMPEVRIPGLPRGELATACWIMGTDRRGEMGARFTVDSGEEVPEMVEDNNVLTETVIVEDLFAEGPALHVRGLEEDNIWLIKYNHTIGDLNVTEGCTLVWGVDDWAFPEAYPRGSSEVDRLCESPMFMGLDGLWQVIIPNQLADELVFKFRDQGSSIDDYHGEGWRIVRTDLVLDMLEEYGRLVTEGGDVGADMSAFESNLSRAWDSYKDGNYTSALDAARGYGKAGVAYVRKLLEIAESDLDWARDHGLDVSREERSLSIAGRVLDAGKYVQAERYCEEVIERIAEERAKVPENLPVAAAMVAAFLALSALAARRRRA